MFGPLRGSDRGTVEWTRGGIALVVRRPVRSVLMGAPGPGPLPLVLDCRGNPAVKDTLHPPAIAKPTRGLGIRVDSVRGYTGTFPIARPHAEFRPFHISVNRDGRRGIGGKRGYEEGYCGVFAEAYHPAARF